LKLDLSVRREKPTELSDVLVITGSRVPESTVWTPPSAPVRIEIFDESEQLVATLQSRTSESVRWMVPDEVQGKLRIVAELATIQTDTRSLAGSLVTSVTDADTVAELATIQEMVSEVL
jgi:hypothetical protein